MAESESNNYVYTDTHAHLGKVAASLGPERLAEVLAAFACCPGATLLDIGTAADDLAPRIAALREAAQGVLPQGLRLSAGLWPGRPSLDDPEAAIAGLEASIEAAAADGIAVAAIGEGGFDFHHMEADAATQARLFSLQCELALRRGLPLLVHSREAFAESIKAVIPVARNVPVIIHCFGYGPEEARAFLDAGCHLSFAGNLTYKKSQALREALVLVPSDRLLLETDAPYMNPDPMRGKPSSPLDIARTYALAASLRGTTPLALAESVAANAKKLWP